MAKRLRLYGTGDEFDYIPFNVDNKPRRRSTRRVFDDLGYEQWRDIFISIDDVPQGGFRHKGAANTPDEVVRRYSRDAREVLPYLKIWYNEVDGFYYPVIDYDGDG